MQITVSGEQVEVSETLRSQVAKQLNGIADQYFGYALESHVTFGRARCFYTCDINMHAGRGLTLRGEGEAADADAAFDDAAEHLAKRLRRYRRRVNEHAPTWRLARSPSRPGSTSCVKMPMKALRLPARAPRRPMRRSLPNRRPPSISCW
jgi:ribosomal subunit interface protein